ncbi:hypothetical protein [Bacteroides fragilis]|uniref:hypothetical protein n=1 Tax=Bacteroides fragilis TaxID=817 RepID=UPI003703EBF8|nr:hypothetical protein [Bacteroides fragilis]MCE8651168.1 hypothetical protein [Bacteroides fragilis]
MKLIQAGLLPCGSVIPNYVPQHLTPSGRDAPTMGVLFMREAASLYGNGTLTMETENRKN